jgi:hypothetical protein
LAFSFSIKNDSIYFEKEGSGRIKGKKKKFRLKESDWENLLICVSDYELPEYAKPRGPAISPEPSEKGISIISNKSSYYCDLRGSGLSNQTVPDLKISELLHIFQDIECAHFINCPKQDTSFTILTETNPGSNEFQCIEDSPNYDISESIKKTVLFEIDSAKNIFSLKDSSSLAQAKTKIYINCQCPAKGEHPISRGKITGIRQTREEWEVQIHVVYSDETGTTYPFQETGIYRYKW